MRVDYQVTQDLRVTWKINRPDARIVPVHVRPTLGRCRATRRRCRSSRWSFNTSWTVNYSLTPTTFLEGTFGINQNRLGTPVIGPASNRNNVRCPADLAAQVANCALGGLPLLFPDAGVDEPGLLRVTARLQVGTPFFEDGQHPAAAAVQLGRHAHRQRAAEHRTTRAS